MMNFSAVVLNPWEVSFVQGSKVDSSCKSACRSNAYLHLHDGLTPDQAEQWIVNYLNGRKNEEGGIEITASGLCFICAR